MCGKSSQGGIRCISSGHFRKRWTTVRAKGKTVTVTEERYIDSSCTCTSCCEQRDILPTDVAMSHTAGESTRNLFPTQVIVRYGDIEWPARSPDVSLWFLLSSDIRSEGSIAIVKKFLFDFLWFLILHHSHSLKMCFRKISVCVCVCVCLSVCPSPIIEPKPIYRSHSNSISRVLL